MTSPWPEPDYEAKIVMCALCFETVPFSRLIRDVTGQLTDICRDCRAMEIRVRDARILDLVEQAMDGRPRGRQNRTAQEIADEIIRFFK